MIARSILTIALTLIASQTLAYQQDLPYGELKAFVSDGCTHFPNGTDGSPNLWLSCCQQHDFRYWIGGTQIDRLNADLELKECVIDKGEFETGNLMYEGVRIGGSPYLPTPWRWGFGWAQMRGYSPLTLDELDVVKIQMPADSIELTK